MSVDEHGLKRVVAAAKRGDESAFRTLFDRYHSKVFGVAYGVLKDREDAKEVTQEAFMKMFRQIG